MAENSVGQVSLDLILNSQSFNNQINKTAKNAGSVLENGIGKSVGKIGKLLAGAFAITQIAKFGKECLDLGSDLQEVQNVVDSTFTTMSEKVNEYASESITKLGMSETAYKKYIGTMGAMSKSFGFTEAKALEMSKSLTELTGDVASFYNLSHEEAYTKLKAVFTGETESLKDLGVVMTQTALDEFALANGFNKLTKDMTEQEKVSLRLAFIQKNLSIASGDFIRTQNGWANQTRILSQQFQALKTNIGQGLINAFTPVIKVINLLMTKLVKLSSMFSNFTKGIFGDAGSSTGAVSGISDTISGVTNEAGDASGAIEGIGDSAAETAKKVQKSFAGIDEITTLSKQPEDSGAGGVGDTGIGDIGAGAEGATQEASGLEKQLSKIAKRLQGIKDIAKEGFKLGLDETGFDDSITRIKKGLLNIKDLFKQIFDSKVIKSMNGALDSFIGYISTLAGVLIGTGAALATGLIEGFVKFLDKNKNFLKEKILIIFNGLKEGFDSLTSITKTFGEIFSNAFKSDAFSTIISNLFTIFINPMITALSLLVQIWKDCLGVIDTYLTEHKTEIELVINNVLKVIADFTTIIADKITIICQKVQEFYEKYIKPNLGEIILIVGKILLGFVALKAIISILAGITTAITGFITAITGIKTAFSLASAGAKIFGSAFTALTSPVGIVVVAIAAVIAIIAVMYTKFESTREAVNSLFNNIKVAFENFKSGFMILFESIKQAYIEYVAPIIEQLKEKIMTCVNDTIVPLINKIIEFIGKLIEQISIIWKLWLAPFLGWLVNDVVSQLAPVIEILINLVFDLVSRIGTFIQGLMDILTGLIDFLIGVFSGDWERAWNGVKTFFEGIWTALTSFIGAIWDIIKNIFSQQISEISNFFTVAWTNIKNFFITTWEAIKNFINITITTIKNIFETTFNAIKNVIETILNTIKNTISNIWNGIKDFIGNTIENIKEKITTGFTNAKNGVINIFTGMRNAIKSIFESLINIVKAPINGVIDLVNNALNGINSISFDLPEMLGGGHVGFDLPNIPKLAEGGYVQKNKPQLAVIGDNKTQGEIITPENKMAEVFESVLEKYFGNLNNNTNTNNSNETIDNRIYLDGQEFYRVMKEYSRKENGRTGSRQMR